MHGSISCQHAHRLGRRAAGGESSLYPALQRLLLKGWVTAEWGASGEQPPGPFYTLTPSGRRQAAAERRDFDRMVLAINRVLDFT